jgi:hypothetical protein
MKRLLVFQILLTATCLAAERKIIVLDETGRGLAGAQIEAVLTPPDDPRLSSVTAQNGRTDAAGVFRFQADEKMILSRVKAKNVGYFTADADHRHGLGRPETRSELTLTLPQLTELVPLHYREVRLTGLPKDKWIGFDAEAVDAIAPWGKGKVADFNLMISYEQTGWTESAEALAMLRQTAEGARMDDSDWAAAYGRFKGVIRLSFPRTGDGVIATPAFWPYCRLKMPALAPTDGYQAEKSLPFDTLGTMESSHDLTGYYLRLRTQLDAEKRITFAHYAKIHGRIEAGPGRASFRFYYNPRTDDRRLAFAPGRNLLRPGPGEPVHHFETQQP